MIEGGANALPWQALGASFPSLSPDPLCVFQHRMALIHMAQGTPKPEDLMKSPDIT